jgi:2-polyprenyl-6-methoxyphenol hydroxylase-like FAD-dependent oxidoreductase
VPAFDVAVVGGGPAGAATCLRLAGSGLRVGLFERSHFQAPRVGEVLAPAVGELLQRLGVGQDVDHAGFVRCHGISSAWGSDQPRFHDFVFGTQGWGWQVERRAFDSMLCTAASTRATEVHLGAVVRSCHHLPDHGWRLTVAQAGELQVYWARFLVIATGRFGLRGTLADQPPIRDDRLIGLVRYVDATASAISPTLASIEAVRDGWWYLGPAPRPARGRSLPDRCGPAAWPRPDDAAAMVVACGVRSFDQIVAAGPNPPLLTQAGRGRLLAENPGGRQPLPGRRRHRAGP